MILRRWLRPRTQYLRGGATRDIVFLIFNPLISLYIYYDQCEKVLRKIRNNFFPHVTHLDEASHMSVEFVFRYGPKCMGGLILPILVLLHL